MTGLSHEYILRHSLCRTPHCAGPYELRDTPLAEWPAKERELYLRRAESEIDDIRYAPEYAEGEGYGDAPERGILFGNWNYFSRDVTDLLEKVGYAIEWNDEWTTCDGCGKALRTSPDSYSWQPGYLREADSCETYCHECADIESVLESYEDQPTRALNDHIDPGEYGYRKLEGDFESGWHPGQNDNPQEIYDRLVALGHKRLLFVIDGVGQFDIGFSIWEKENDQ